MSSIKDYQKDRHSWITLIETEFYPDYLDLATEFYEPIIGRFGELLNKSKSSVSLFQEINKENPSIRIQLQRIFRKYVSPNTSVEMLKVKSQERIIIKNYGKKFRNISEVKKRFRARRAPDEALVAVLHEYKARGQKGYELTEAFFNWFRAKFGEKYTIEGPERAGPDIPLRAYFPDYPVNTTVDFIILDKKKNPLIIGYARYDSDRGGAQGLDRINSYSDKVTEILSYAKKNKVSLKILFLNDGPGLLLGLLWQRYSQLEEKGRGRVVVSTLKMLDKRITESWIKS